MPWVPIHESGVDFTFYGAFPPHGEGEVFSLSDSTVTNINSWVYEGWRLEIDAGGSQRFRLTTSLTGECYNGDARYMFPGTYYTPQDEEYYVGGDSGEEHSTQIQSEDAYESMEFASGFGEICGMEYSALIEIWVEDELVANDDEATTNADTPVTVDVLANDTFGDEPVALEQLEGPPTIHEQPANGTVSVGADGRITYTPGPGFTGTDEFVYRIELGVPLPCLEIFVESGGPGDNVYPPEPIDLAPYWGSPEITIVIGSVEYVFTYDAGGDWYEGPANFPYCSPNSMTGEVRWGDNIRCAEIWAFCA